ncbi:MAG: DUF4365 domain-containing protein [Bacteroidota bacterium]
MKKKRTRQHIIEDLGLNYVERQFLLAGHSVQRIYRDYGYDANVFTYDINGEVENGMILIQLKSSDQPKLSKDQQAIEYSLSKRDLELWLLEREMMLLVFYDADSEKAYFVILQEYFTKNKLSLQQVRKYIQIRIDLANELTPESVKEIRAIKNKR